jgi:4-alpha-glucanotransferase/alpha-amylase
VSQSEDGFEKIMQALTLTLRWPVVAGVSSIVVALEVRRA